jgi:hypothetical protein
MITAYLQGGLGNQMFQLAAAISLAIDNHTNARFGLGNHFLPKQGRRCHLYQNNIFKNIDFAQAVEIKKIFKEPTFLYSKIEFEENMCLSGYFQSEKYFVHNKEIITRLFLDNEEALGYLLNKYRSLLIQNSVSLHVRRGDYLKSNGFHPTCSMDYYEKAMAEFPEDTQFLVFSDDIGWCKESFKGKNFNFIEEEDYLELLLTSLCRHNIIANSSFSWWGAWLNQNPEKQVFYPSNWFGPDSNIDTRDLTPQEWKRI